MSFTKSLLSPIFIILILFSLHAGSVMYDENVDMNIYNITESRMSYNATDFQTTPINISANHSVVLNTRISNVITKSIDTVVYITFEMSKGFIEIGYNNHESVGSSGLITFLEFMMVLIMIGILFYPTLVIAFLIYEGVKLFIKKYRR